jgi:hypothetical protein
LSSTNLVEEIIGMVKNFKECKASPKYRNPAVSLGRILASQVVQKRTRFDAVEEASTGKAPDLPKDAFHGSRENWSLPFEKVQGTSSTAPFYSPSAKNRNTPVADIYLVRAAKRNHSLDLVEDAWLGKMFSSQHSFAYELQEPTGKTWIYPVHCWPDSAVLALQLEVVSLPGNLHYFNITKKPDPFLVGIFKIPKTSRACVVEAHSPYWQLTHTTPQVRTLSPAVRLFKTGNFKPLHVIACEAAFWLMPRNDVADFSAYWGFPIVGASDLFETLLAAIQGLLGISIDDALNLVHKRLANMAKLTRYSKAADPKTGLLMPWVKEAVAGLMLTCHASYRIACI